MKLKTLSTGSKGNCYLLTNKEECLILDLGIPDKRIKKALEYDFEKVVGAAVTHSHSDHALSVECLDKMGVKVFKPYLSNVNFTKVQFGNFKIQAFPLKHDVPCFGFYITHPDIGQMLYITDTEYVPQSFAKLQVEHILVEANYSKSLVSDEQVKRNRVLQTHMDIDTTCKFLEHNNSNKLQNVILCHLSDGSSNEEEFITKAKKTVNCHVYACDSGMEIELNNGKCPF